MHPPPADVAPQGPRQALLEAAFGVLARIRESGHAAVIVGGAVRDHVLGRPLTDVDLATDMPLESLAALFRTHAVGRSRQFETVVVVSAGQAFEVSRFRRGAAGAGAGAEADPVREDTAHRDFTINALAMGHDGRIVDHRGGLADLRRRVVRAVGAPRERFAEDPARVLRAVRFSACLGFTIDEATAAAMSDFAPRLSEVAGERVGKEILKAASQPGAALAEAVALMERFGLLGTLLPEVRALRGLRQPEGKHPEGDCWEHTLAALRASASADPAVNLAVLLHDVGKPPTHRVDGGQIRFPGHEQAGALLAEAVARRLFLPQRVRAAVVFSVAHHGEAWGLGSLRRSRRLALVTAEHWPVLRAVALCDRAAGGPAADVATLEEDLRRAEADAAAAGGPQAVAAAISGERVMALTGLPPGPRVGEIRRRVTEWALDLRVEDPAAIDAETVRVAGEGVPDA